MYINYRQLNSVIKKDLYPLVTILEDLISYKNGVIYLKIKPI